MTKDQTQQVLDALQRYQIKRQDFDTFAEAIAIMQAAVDAPECHHRPACEECAAPTKDTP